MLEVFSDRDALPYRDMVPWAGEFAGKYLTSATQVLRATGDERLAARLRDFITRLIARQAPDGYLGPWPRDARLTNRSPHHPARDHQTWDTWGHYHVMLGLTLYHDLTGDRRALACARRIADLFCRKYLGDRSPRLVDTGEPEKNMAPVHALAMLYSRTRCTLYLQLAEQLVCEFAHAGDYVRLALAGKAFHEMPEPRWEALHSVMALAELHRVTGNADYARAFERIWWSIAEGDRHNNGGFTSGERATGDPYGGTAIETCCTIAWIAMSIGMLRLTGESVVADEIELSTLNSVLGMHSRTGRWATYSTPSDGLRFASAHRIVFQARAGSPELNCCSVNAPRGLGMLGDWAVMRSADGVCVNYYGPGAFAVALPDGTSFGIEQETDYPASGRVRLTLQPEQPTEMALSLRVPHWSARTRAAVNGKRIRDIRPGSYLTIERRWRRGDEVTLDLDMSLHFWRGGGQCKGLTSVYRGPVLLACDLRHNRDLPVRQAGPYGGDPHHPGAGLSTPVPRLDARTLKLKRARWSDWLPPFLLFETLDARGRMVRLCDFASAGETGTPYRSWLPVVHAPRRRAFSRENPLRSARLEAKP